MKRRTILVAALIGHAIVRASDKGYLGFAVSVDGEGYSLNPVLRSVKVAKVTPGSPADKAGLRVGDAIVEIEGRAVVGARANDLKPYMDRLVGQTVRMAVQRPSGEVSHVALVAGRRGE